MVSVTAPEGIDPLSRVHIMLVADSLDAGGAERHVVDLAIALQGQQHQVTVACSSLGAFEGTLRDTGIEMAVAAPCRTKRRVSAVYALGLRRLIAERKPALIHSHMYASGTAAAIATLGTGIPLVHTEHSEAGWRSPRARLWARWAHHRSDQVVAVSQSIRDRLIEIDSMDPARVTMIRNAVPAASLQPATVHWPFEPGAPLAGVVARLHPEKGVEIFLEAAAHVHRMCARCRFVVVGSGPSQEQLEKLAEGLGLQGVVHFAGSHPDARALFSLLDLVVVPSLSEGTPLVPLEAMHAARPVIATTAGGLPDQIGHGETGLLVPPGNPEALAGAILHLLRE